MLTLKKLSVVSTALIAFISLPAFSSSISLEQVTKDVSYLASDELAGRKSNSEGSRKAAEFISKRFAEIGLEPLNGLKSFTQEFVLHQVKLESVEVTLNKKLIKTEDSILLTSHSAINWKEGSDIKRIHIGPSENFQKVMADLNQLKEDIFVTVDKAHKPMFSRFRNYFMRGANRFKINKGPSAVIVLSDESNDAALTVNAKTKSISQSLANVAGVLPGKSKPQEYVLFSAHYDHLGETTKVQEDKIYNGADDDASGTSAVINLAQHFAKLKNNERTLVFVAFTAEEIGGFGSQYFSQQMNPKDVIAMINIEMIGKPSKFGKGSFWMTGYDRSNLGKILNRNLEPLGKKLYPDPYPKFNLFYRSDNATLARLGVPAHSFSSSQIDKDKHYHQASDEVETLDLESMHKVINGIADSVTSLINGKDTPTRVDTSKVKPKGNFY